MSVAPLVVALVQVTVAVAFAPLVIGVTRQTRARLEGRVGPGVLQPARDLRKLLAKTPLRAAGTSPVTVVAPVVLLTSSLLLAALVPLVAALPLSLVPGDLFVAVSVLLLGTVAIALLGLDAGSAFGGMGASREMTIAALTEPTLATAILALAVTAQSTNLGEIVSRTLATPATTLGPGHLLAFAALFIVTLAETGRLPVDNPSTHLELTMIHEAMILEYSGRYLALIEWAAALALGQGADEFLGTQGDPWDTQSDMFMALIGASVALLLLPRVQDRQMTRL